MKNTIMTIIAVLVFSVLTFADYGYDMRRGNELYKSGKYTEALEFYRNAYMQNPDEKLGVFINKLEQHLAGNKKAGVKEPESPGNILSVSGLNLVEGEICIEYQRALGKDFSVAVGGLYAFLRNIAGGYAAIYYYPEKNALKSWFGGVGLFYSQAINPPPTGLPFNFSVMLAARLGYRWILGPFSIDIVSSYPIVTMWTSTSMVYSVYGGIYTGLAF
jgi:hypothetical protein